MATGESLWSLDTSTVFLLSDILSIQGDERHAFVFFHYSYI
jgi:hypothetical protein